MAPERSTVSLRQRGLRGSVWVLSQAAFTNFAGLVSVVLVARYITPDEFGVVALAAVFASVALVLSDIGLSPALLRESQPNKRTESTAFWISLGVAVAAMVLLVILSPMMAQAFGEPRIQWIIVALSTQLPLATMRLIPIATLTRNMDFRPLAIRQSLAQVSGLTVAVPTAILGGGAWALVAQALTAAVIDTATLLWFKPWRPEFMFDRSSAVRLLGIGTPAAFTQMIHILRDRGTDLILAVLLGTYALGVWTVATRITNTVVQLFSTVIAQIALPVFAVVKDDRTRLTRVFAEAIRTSAYVSVPGMVTLAAISPNIIPLVFGPQWAGAGEVAGLVSLATAVTVVQWFDTHYWLAIGKPRVELGLVTTISVAHLFLVATSAQFGVTAIATAVLARTIISVPLRIHVMTRFGTISWQAYRPLWITLLVSLPIGAVIYYGGLALQGRLPATAVVSIQGAGALFLFIAASCCFKQHPVAALLRDLRPTAT